MRLESGAGHGLRALSASTGRAKRPSCATATRPASAAGRSLKALANIEGPIAAALAGADGREQAAIDARLIEPDGSDDKSALGANALLAVSLATAHAGASSAGLPLYRYLATGSSSLVLPTP